MNEPRWLLKEAVIAVHKMLVAEFGGIDSIRDEGLLESALSRPQQKFIYEKPSLFAITAAYGFGLAKNHPFSDGNKRIALTAMAMFLGSNGYKLIPEKMDAYQTTIKLAAGVLTEEELANWIEANVIAK